MKILSASRALHGRRLERTPNSTHYFEALMEIVRGGAVAHPLHLVL